MPVVQLKSLSPVHLNNCPERHEMNTIKSLAASTLAVVALVGLSGCADMNQRDRSIATGAAIGGVAGAVLTGGSALGTVGGAAVGGVIGNEVDKNKR